MATSGSAEKVVTSYDTLRFSWWFNSGDQNIANNTTLVRWKLELIASAYGYISGGVAKPWNVVVNGQSYGGNVGVGISNNTTKTLAEGTTTVAHNSDGTKTFNFSFSQSFSGITFSGVSLGVVSGSGSGVLTTIPRASSLTAANGTLGTAQNLTITRASSGFTHTITYTCGVYSGTVVTKTTGTSVSFTPAIGWATGAPYGDKVYVSFRIDTYSGNTLIGSKTTDIWCSIPASVKPSISGVTVQEGSSVVPSGFPYVQGRSQLRVQVSAVGNQGSTIQKCDCKVDGVVYSGTNITSNVITRSGTVSVEVTVTDTRGRTATQVVSVEVEAYTEPVIENANAFRCKFDGTRDETGEYIRVVARMSVTPLLAKNTCAFYVKYKKTSEEEYTTIEVGEVQNGSYYVLLRETIEADTGSSYDVVLVAADSFATDGISKSFIAPTAYTIFNIRANGKGFAFGKVSERDGIEFAQVLYDGNGNVIPIGDSGWIELPLNTGWWTYESDYPYDVASYRKIGNIVYLRGMVGSTAEAASIIADLPEGFRPSGSYNRFIVCHNQYDTAAIQINMGGQIVDMSKANRISVSRMFLNLAGVSFVAGN